MSPSKITILGQGTWRFTTTTERLLAIKRAMVDPVSHEWPADVTDEELRDVCWWQRPPDERA